VRNATLRLYASVAAVVAGPLLLAALGVTHPQDLTEETASWWHELHTILVAVFPLLGLNLWWLLRGLEGVTAWLSRVAGFLYIVFYGALDVLAGVGTGATVEAARREGRETIDDGNPLLFDGAMRSPTSASGPSDRLCDCRHPDRAASRPLSVAGRSPAGARLCPLPRQPHLLA